MSIPKQKIKKETFRDSVERLMEREALKEMKKHVNLPPLPKRKPKPATIPPPKIRRKKK